MATQNDQKAELKKEDLKVENKPLLSGAGRVLHGSALVSAERGAEIENAKLAVSKGFQKFQTIAALILDVAQYMKDLRASVVSLENRRAHLNEEVKLVEARMATAEQEIKTRLAGIDHGHAALIERLTEKELSVQEKERKLERMDMILREKDMNLELLRSDYERRLGALTEMEKKQPK